MQKSEVRQLELRLAKPTAAERKALIRDRLVGYGFRQAAREAKRRQTSPRRETVLPSGTISSQPGFDSEQLNLPHFPAHTPKTSIQQRISKELKILAKRVISPFTGSS